MRTKCDTLKRHIIKLHCMYPSKLVCADNYISYARKRKKTCIYIYSIYVLKYKEQELFEETPCETQRLERHKTQTRKAKKKRTKATR